MIPIERCDKILRTHNLKLSNEEVKQVREQLYLFAALQMEFEKNKKIKDEEND